MRILPEVDSILACVSATHVSKTVTCGYVFIMHVSQYMVLVLGLVETSVWCEHQVWHGMHSHTQTPLLGGKHVLYAQVCTCCGSRNYRQARSGGLRSQSRSSCSWNNGPTSLKQSRLFRTRTHVASRQQLQHSWPCFKLACPLLQLVVELTCGLVLHRLDRCKLAVRCCSCAWSPRVFCILPMG